MCLNVVVLIHFSHVFESDAVVKPLCPLANRTCGCFVRAPAPFVCLVCFSGCFPVFSGETQVWLGDLRVVVFWWSFVFFLVVLLWFACVYGQTVSLYKRLLDCLCSCKDRALARHRPNSRKKKPRSSGVARSRDGLVNVAWVVLHCNRRIGARKQRQLIPHVRFQVPFLGPKSQLKSGFACAGLLCSNSICLLLIFPSNAFMASARSLHTFDRSKRWIVIFVHGCLFACCSTKCSCHFFLLHGSAFALAFAILRSHFWYRQTVPKMGPWKCFSFVLLLSCACGPKNGTARRAHFWDRV